MIEDITALSVLALLLQLHSKEDVSKALNRLISGTTEDLIRGHLPSERARYFLEDFEQFAKVNLERSE